MGRFFHYFLLAILGFSLGVGRWLISIHEPVEEDIDFYNGQVLEFAGVVEEVDVRRNKAKYTIAVEGEFEGQVLITLKKYPQLAYGDRVEVYGELQAPGAFNGFNYGDYLSRFSTYSVMYYPHVEVLESGQGSLFWHGMTWLQSRFMQQINLLFPEPHASFEAGLLVGARKGIPEELMEKFNITGLTHIIAISGYNITIIIVFVMWMLKGLPRKTGFVVAIAAIVLFTLFVGASPAVVRASIMGILGLIALNYGRQNNINLTILWSAALMVVWNPKVLVYDVGFQLSFAAVMGLIYVAPHFEKYSQKLPEAFGIREAIVMTLSAQVMALPIIIYNFERLSMIAPISNLLVAFAIPPAMMFGFVAVLLSFIFQPLAMVFAYLAWGILTYIIKIIEWTALIPYASVDIPGMRFWMMVGYYVGLGFLLWWVEWRRRKFQLQNDVEHSARVLQRPGIKPENKKSNAGADLQSGPAFGFCLSQSTPKLLIDKINIICIIKNYYPIKTHCMAPDKPSVAPTFISALLAGVLALTTASDPRGDHSKALNSPQSERAGSPDGGPTRAIVVKGLRSQSDVDGTGGVKEAGEVSESKNRRSAVENLLETPKG